MMPLHTQLRKSMLATPPGRLLKRTLKTRTRHPGLMAGHALDTLIENCDFQSVLDVGSGAGKHSDVLEEAGKSVTAIDFGVSVYYQQKTSRRLDIVADYYKHKFETPFDCVWASHVLEHQPNPNLFLKKVFSDVREGGWVAITVPPLKHSIVGGHLTLWNAGLLLYQMVFAGFDCADASVCTYDYNVSVIARKRSIGELPELHFDNGDVDRLAEFLPDGLSEGFDGRIRRLNWPPTRGN